MSHTARIKMDGKLVGYLLLFSPLHYITISGNNDVPIPPETLLSLPWLTAVSRTVPYLHISISMELTKQVCPGYLQSPCEGPWAPCCLSQYSCGYQWVLWRGWYVGSDPIRRLERRHSAYTIIIHSKYSRKDIMEICTHYWTQAG